METKPTEVAGFLLDTTALIDFLRLRGGESITDLLEELKSKVSLASCPVTVAEVFAGTKEKDEEKVDAFLSTLVFYPITYSALRLAGRWRYSFARKGVTLSLSEILIAAVAVENRLALVTANAWMRNCTPSIKGGGQDGSDPRLLVRHVFEGGHPRHARKSSPLMESAVVDASVAPVWVLPGEASREAMSLRNRAVEDSDMVLLVPPNILVGGNQCLWVGVRRRRLEAEETLSKVFHQAFDLKCGRWILLHASP